MVLCDVVGGWFGFGAGFDVVVVACVFVFVGLCLVLCLCMLYRLVVLVWLRVWWLCWCCGWFLLLVGV